MAECQNTFGWSLTLGIQQAGSLIGVKAWRGKINGSVMREPCVGTAQNNASQTAVPMKSLSSSLNSK